MSGRIVALALTLSRVIAAGFGEVPETDTLRRMARELCSNKFVLLTLITLVGATAFSGFFTRINGPEEFGAYLLLIFLFTLGLPADLVGVLKQAPLYFVFCGISRPQGRR